MSDFNTNAGYIRRNLIPVLLVAPARPLKKKVTAFPFNIRNFKHRELRGKYIHRHKGKSMRRGLPRYR